MNTRMILGPVLAGALALGGTAGAMSVFDERPTTESSAAHVSRVHTSAVTDLGDDRKLVGLAHNVFLGTVVRERGRTISEPLPEIQYDVRVRRPVKGTLSGVVVVSQQGGVNETGETVIVDGDLPLQTGRTYLFATRTNETTGWHTLFPRYGDLPVDTAQKQASVVQRFQVARGTEIPFSPGA